MLLRSQFRSMKPNWLPNSQNSRHFRRMYNSHSDDRSRPFGQRMREALKNTKLKWYPIPLSLGFAYISFQQYRHIRERERRFAEEEEEASGDKVVITREPWQVHVASILPLRSMSRLWGNFNSITIPAFLRPIGFKLYSWIFGCDLNEMRNPDLKSYRNLSEFFYRELKPGIRPIEPALLVSPADGRVLHFGVVKGRRVEQVKGMTYSLDALIGKKKTGDDQVVDVVSSSHSANIVDEEEFANVNGIPYSLDNLIGDHTSKKVESFESKVQSTVDVPPRGILTDGLREGNGLFFCVIYLAPGDYHHFHSPTNWVVETRRHFAGELFSVSPYMVKLLENLFILNERVVLLGRWRYGSFSMIPVGATNVGSIKINFDEALKTNQKRLLPIGTYTEVSYKSKYNGKQLRIGEEMGGFCLGSTVVLVFEAPLTLEFKIEAGQKIKVGQALADVPK